MSDDTHPMPEAPEPPPRGVLLMSIVRWVLLLAMTGLAVYAARTYGFGGAASQPAREARYYCPMHPQITSPDPGECPICHMTLEPIPHDRSHATGPMSAAVTDAQALAVDAATDANAAPRSVVLTLDRRQAIGVATTAVERREVRDPLRVPAVVAIRENGESEVHVRAPTFIERVAVRETGVRVRAGEVLAWGYSPAIYRAQQDLFTAGRWTSAGNSDGSSASNEGARMLGAARESLRLLGVSDGDIDAIVRSGAPMRQVPIRATSGGVVMRRTAVPGLYAQPETALYEVADLSRVWVNASVFAGDIARIHRGDVARFLANGDGTDVEARVALIEPSIDAATRTARVRLEVANPGTRWRPGAFGEVSFVATSRSAMVVPRDAIIDPGDGRYVFVDAGEGRFEARRIEAGATIGDVTEVLSGLREGERVVVRGAFLLDAETRLRSAVSNGGAP